MKDLGGGVDCHPKEGGAVEAQRKVINDSDIPRHLSPPKTKV